MLDIKQNDIICISQPHGGKRCAMMTGFRITLLENENIIIIDWL